MFACQPVCDAFQHVKLEGYWLNWTWSTLTRCDNCLGLTIACRQHLLSLLIEDFSLESDNYNLRTEGSEITWKGIINRWVMKEWARFNLFMTGFNESWKSNVWIQGCKLTKWSSELCSIELVSEMMVPTLTFGRRGLIPWYYKLYFMQHIVLLWKVTDSRIIKDNFSIHLYVCKLWLKIFTSSLTYKKSVIRNWIFLNYTPLWRNCWKL